MIRTSLKLLFVLTTCNSIGADIYAGSPVPSTLHQSFLKKHSSLLAVLTVLGCGIIYRLFTNKSAQEPRAEFGRKRKESEPEYNSSSWWDKYNREQEEEIQREEREREERNRRWEEQNRFWDEFNRQQQEENQRWWDNYDREQEERNRRNNAHHNQYDDDFWARFFNHGGGAAPGVPFPLPLAPGLKQLYEEVGIPEDQTPFQVLGVANNASAAEIEAAFKRFARQWHPDKHVNDTEAEKQQATARFKLYSVCRDHCVEIARRRV